MRIPKYHRQLLKSIGFPHWFWFPINDWAYGKRYKFTDGSIAYLRGDEIVTVRRADKILWRREK